MQLRQQVVVRRQKLILCACALLLAASCADEEFRDLAQRNRGAWSLAQEHVEAARGVCRARADNFDWRRRLELNDMGLRWPEALARKCLYVEMLAALPEAQRPAAAPTMAKFASEATFRDDAPLPAGLVRNSHALVPAQLSDCPARLGEGAWPGVWRLASVDVEVGGRASSLAGPMALLPALCAEAGDEARGGDATLAAFVPRLAEAEADDDGDGDAAARWPLLETLARLWTHSDRQARASLAHSLAGAGEGLWPALAAWRDAADEVGAPPPASLPRAVGIAVGGFSARRCGQALMAGLAGHSPRAAADMWPPATDPGRQGDRAPGPPGPPTADDQEPGPSVWDGDLRGDTGHLSGAEWSQSVMSKEEAAQDSAQRLIEQFDLTPPELDGLAPWAIAGIAAVADDIEAGRRSGAAMRAAHPEVTLADQLGVLRMVLNQNLAWAGQRWGGGPHLLGHRGLALAWVAILRFDHEPDGQRSTDPAHDRSLMTDSLLRNLTEAVSGGPSDYATTFTTVCFKGTGARAIRSLQGYYRSVVVDTNMLPPVDLLGVLGEAFSRRHPEPTAAQIETFVRDARQCGGRMYRRSAAKRAYFERLIDDYEASPL